MAPSIIVVTEKHDSAESPVEYSLKESRQNLNKSDYYDKALPKTDLKLLIPIRRWEKEMGFVTPLVWTNIILIFSFHVVCVVYPLFIACIYAFPMWQSVIFSFFCGGVGGFGITAGPHRYWTHRSFKAKIPLQIIMMLCFSLSGQNNIPNWVRDHRVHHKMSETTADPHDANRGFFFAHVGWLMMKKHPNVIREGNKIDMSDILNDPLVKWHTKHFIVLRILFCFMIPTVIPPLLWGELWTLAIANVLVRYLLNLHITWSVNSFAHLWGNKPYNNRIMPTENWKVSLVAMGEGWHNYHHTFPWDYKAAELAYFINITTFLIDCFAFIGWAYDLKVASPTLINDVITNKGLDNKNHQLL